MVFVPPRALNHLAADVVGVGIADLATVQFILKRVEGSERDAFLDRDIQ